MSQIEYKVNKSTRKTIKYSEAGAVVSIGRFPIGTQLSVNVTIDEVFDNANNISVGTPSVDNRFFNEKSVVTAAGETSGLRYVTVENDTEIIAIVSGTATAGAVTVTVDYTLPTNEIVSY